MAQGARRAPETARPRPQTHPATSARATSANAPAAAPPRNRYTAINSLKLTCTSRFSPSVTIYHATVARQSTNPAKVNRDFAFKTKEGTPTAPYPTPCIMLECPSTISHSFPENTKLIYSSSGTRHAERHHQAVSSRCSPRNLARVLSAKVRASRYQLASISRMRW